jgi:hypothetical protein
MEVSKKLKDEQFQCTIVPYGQQYRDQWENFLKKKPRNSDFMFSRKFLEYHGDKFIDRSLLFLDSKKEVIAVFPAASNRNEITLVSSHLGASYGGFVYDSRFGGTQLVRIASMAVSYYRDIGIQTLIIRPKPFIYSKTPGGEDMYVWWRQGAEIQRVDISNALDVLSFKLSPRRLRTLKKLDQEEYEIIEGESQIEKAYEICDETLRRRHDVMPVHTLKDLKYICRELPESIRITAGYLNGEISAALFLFLNQNAAVVQYWGSSESGRKMNSLDPLVIEAINWCKEEGLRWFVPGVSTSNNGEQVDDGIYEYKVSFGSGSITNAILKLKL